MDQGDVENIIISSCNYALKPFIVPVYVFSANAMLENTKTTIKNLKNNTQALCKADRGTFVLGTPNKIVCNGEISNQIIFENSPGLPTLGICEISIVARYAFYQ